MAVIGSIRNRGKLIAGVVFFALALFVLGALLENRGGGRGRGGDSIGEIAGEKVSVQEFTNRVEEQAQLYRDNGTTVDDQMNQQIRNGVWNDILRERTLKVQAEDAGFGSTISKEEFDDIRFGDNVVPDFKNNQNFQKNGQPDKERLRMYFKNVQEQMPMLYEMQKRTLVPQRIYAKYNALVKKSCFVNQLQLQDEWAQKNTKASFNFVMKRFDQEADSLYAVNDEDLKRYYNAHKSERKWKQQASRGFIFVQFNALPTAEDIAETKKEMEDLKEDFQKIRGKADSAFVVSRSDSKNATATAYQPGSADVENDSLIAAHADTNTVVGPFKQGDTWKLVKVTQLADVPEAKVRHILLLTQGKSPEETEKFKVRADSLLNVVKHDRKKFPELVKKFSEDPGSNRKEGDEAGVYDWFDKTRMVPEFTKASFDEPKGAITVAKTDYGYHVVEVLDQRTRKERRVLTVDRKVQTVNAMKDAYKKANEFSLTNTDTASFRKSAQAQGLNVTPVDQFRPENGYVPGLQDANTVKTWANRAELGSKPSEPLASGDSYVVCLLTAVREDGEPKLDDVRDAFTKEARKEKKAEALVAKMTGKTDLSALSTEVGSTVQTASDMTLNTNSVPGGGNDVEVIGQIFSLKDGDTSTPLKGDMGVYVVKMDKVTAAAAMPEGAEDKKTAADRIRNRAEYQAFSAIKEAAGVRDDRSMFY